MNLEIFNFWYSRLDNLQPMTLRLVRTCTSNLECANCSCRQGCPIRPIFYLDDLAFEAFLQSSELKIRNYFSLASENEKFEELSNLTFMSSEKIRIKRRLEITEHESYSGK